MTSSSGPVPVVDGRREGGLDTLRVATGARGHRRRREGQGARTLEIRHFRPKYPRCPCAFMIGCSRVVTRSCISSLARTFALPCSECAL